MAEAAGDYSSLCSALCCVGIFHEDRGEFATSRPYAERALEIAERVGDRGEIAYMTTRRGMSAFYMGDWVQARRDYEQAVAISHDLEALWYRVWPLLDLGRLCLAEGAWEQACQCLDECETMVRSSGDLTTLREVQSLLAERDLLVGHPEAARARLVPLLDRAGLQEAAVTSLLPRLAWAHLELGEVKQAGQEVAQAIARTRDENKQLYRLYVEALRVQAMVLIRQGRWAEAGHALEEGVSLARSMPYPYAEARLLHLFGLMHAQRREPEPAWEHLEAALAIFRRLGARKDVERVERDIADLQRP